MAAKDTSRAQRSSAGKVQRPLRGGFRSIGGTEFRFNDTPGSTQVTFRSPAGSLVQYDQKGSKCELNPGDSTSYTKGGKGCTCDEGRDCKTGGQNSEMNAAGKGTQTAGDTGGATGGDVASVMMKKNNSMMESSYRGIVKDSNENIGGAKTGKVGKQYAMNAAKISFNGAAGGASDINLKHDIQDIPNALETVCKMRGVSFKWNDTKWLGHRRRHGVIAQEMELVLPEVVDKDDNDGHKMVYYTELVSHLIEAIKELKTEVDTLKAAIPVKP